MQWYKAINALAQLGEPYVIATVVATSGSTPRPAGTKMVITREQEHDTLGGGQLEHLVIARARKLLGAENTTQHIEHFPLAAAALQCCGGSVTVLLECFAQHALRVAVFGAGHIGERVVGLLEDIGAHVHWFDAASRASEGDLLSDKRATLLQKIANPASEIQNLPAATHTVVVTHDHQLDYALLQAALQQGIAHYASLGVIGSATKWQRFRARLLADGYGSDTVNAIRCPLGAGTATDKQPSAIAIAIVAELLNLSGAEQRAELSRATASTQTDSNLSWKQIKSTLVQSL